MPKQFSVKTKAEPRNLKSIRDFFEKAARGNMEQEDVFRMEVCLNEICENIIRYGYEKRKRETINIKARFDKGEVRITVIDKGKPFNLLEYDPIDTGTLVKKGIKGKLGIRIIKTVCDDIHYKRLKGENQTVLIKKWNKRSSPAPTK
jgi:anti-sigma regulatory factor (Ser/Thr protein kinase)